MDRDTAFRLLKSAKPDERLRAARARQLVGLPSGNTVLDYRDRAILKFFLYSGARLSTACRLKVSDFHQDGDEATIARRLCHPDFSNSS